MIYYRPGPLRSVQPQYQPPRLTRDTPSAIMDVAVPTAFGGAVVYLGGRLAGEKNRTRGWLLALPPALIVAAAVHAYRGIGGARGWDLLG